MNMLPRFSQLQHNKPFHDIKNIQNVESVDSEDEDYDSIMLYQKSNSSRNLKNGKSQTNPSNKWHLRPIKSMEKVQLASNQRSSFRSNRGKADKENIGIPKVDDSRFMTSRFDSARSFEASSYSLASVVPDESSTVADEHVDDDGLKMNSYDNFDDLVDYIVEDYVNDDATLEEDSHEQAEQYRQPLEEVNKGETDEEYLEKVFSKARHNRIEEIIDELGHGFDLTKRDKFGNTLIHICAQNNHVKLATKIFQKFPSVDLNVRNLKLLTPLDYAEKYKFVKMRQWLVDRGGQTGVPEDQFRSKFR